MTPFAVRTRRTATTNRRGAVPAGFVALADALDGTGAVGAAAEEIGRRAACEGAAVDELLGDLARTYLVAGPAPSEPPLDVVRVVCTAWADASLRYFHAVSCEDPLTGLASRAHVSSRLAEIYRASERDGVDGAPDFVLLIIEIQWADSCSSHFDKVLRTVDVAELMRTVYTGDEVIGQLKDSRVVAIVRRDHRLGESVAGLLGLLHDWQERCGVRTRLWIEGLPASALSGEALIDELAR